MRFSNTRRLSSRYRCLMYIFKVYRYIFKRDTGWGNAVYINMDWCCVTTPVSSVKPCHCLPLPSHNPHTTLSPHLPLPLLSHIPHTTLSPLCVCISSLTQPSRNPVPTSSSASTLSHPSHNPLCLPLLPHTPHTILSPLCVCRGPFRPHRHRGQRRVSALYFTITAADSR